MALAVGILHLLAVVAVEAQHQVAVPAADVAVNSQLTDESCAEYPIGKSDRFAASKNRLLQLPRFSKMKGMNLTWNQDRRQDA